MSALATSRYGLLESRLKASTVEVGEEGGQHDTRNLDAHCDGFRADEQVDAFAGRTERKGGVGERHASLAIVIRHAFPVVESVVFIAIRGQAAEDIIDPCGSLRREHTLKKGDDNIWGWAPNPACAQGRLDEFRIRRRLKRHAAT